MVESDGSICAILHHTPLEILGHCIEKLQDGVKAVITQWVNYKKLLGEDQTLIAHRVDTIIDSLAVPAYKREDRDFFQCS
jgi:hypothetical protein